jgi:beta-N-acetylhexosaminidase
MKSKLNISDLNIRELAAQCMFPRISAEQYYSDKEYQQEIHKLVEEGIGGFCVFQGTMGHVKSMTTVLQSIAKIPLLFCADYENGLPMRLDNGTAFPHAMALGRTGNTEHTYNAAKIIAKEAKSIGIDWNLAPVCDINSNRENPIINIRSFSEDVETVNLHSDAFIKALYSEKMLSCAKHFPGHGDTQTDSHLALPVLKHSRERLNELELKPFIHAINSGVQSIMVGHLAVPALDDSNLPVSLSKKVITGILRNELKFDGLILTDALDMNSVTNNFSSEEAVIKALESGLDVLLMPAEPLHLIDVLEDVAKKEKRIYEHLQSAVERIIKAKEWCGLYDKKQDKQEEIPFSEHEKIALSAAYDALEISGDENLIPINEKFRVGGFAFLQTDDIETPSNFFRILAQAIENDCDFGFIDKNILEKDLTALKEGIQYADILVFAFFFRPSAYHSLTIPEEIMKAYKTLSEGKKTIAVLFGNPYLKDSIKADLIISPFSDSLPSIAAAILKLSGREIFN